MPILLLVVAVVVAVALLGQKPKLEEVSDVVPWQIYNKNFAHNNPMNTKPNPDRTNPWNGQVGVDNRGLCIFDTMPNGLRAGAIDSLSDFLTSPGLTLIQFGEEYAPSQLQRPITPYGGYGQGLAKTLHVPAGDPYNARTKSGLVALLHAIIVNENTKDPLPSAMLDTAADAARLHFHL